MQQSIKQGISNGWFAEVFMPVGDGELTGDECRTNRMTIFDDFEQVMAFGLRQLLANSRKDARDLVKKLRGDLDSHGEVVLDAQRMTFGDLAAVYEKQRLVPAVIVDGRKVAGLRSSYSAKRLLIPLVAHFGRKHVRKITHSDLEGYKLIRLQTPVIIKKRPADSAELKSTGRRSSKKAKGKSRTQETISRQRSLSAVNRELELLRTIFNFAEHNDWVVKSPFKRGASLISKASERQRDRILTREEETRLLAACNGKRAHLRGLLICALDTAMRRGELFKLKWPDVDFPANLIRIRATNTKTERARTVGMTPRVADALTALRNQAHDRLKRAAAILAAREGPFKGQEGKARSALLEIARGHLGKTFENYFPIVAGKALEIVSDALVKHDFNVTLQHFGPSRYPSSMKSSLMEQFSGLVALLLDIHSGPLPATRKPAPARRYSAETLRREMSLKIQELSRGGDPTRKVTAIRLGLSNEKALDRLRQYHSDTRRWRDVVSEALTEK